MFWPMKDCSFRLCRVDLATRSQFSKISLSIKVIFSLGSKPDCSAHNKPYFAFPDKLRENLLLSWKTRNVSEQIDIKFLG